MTKQDYVPPMDIAEITFPGGRVTKGRITADPGSKIIPDEKTGGYVLMLDNGRPGALIPPCECATYQGTCRQATSEADDGTIMDVYCESIGCGFCVGGIYSPDGAFRMNLRFAMAAT